MPNSLRAEIKKLRYKGKITDEECTRLLSKLDGHDKAIKALEAPPNDNWEGYSKRLWKSAYEYGKAEQTSALDKIRAEIIERDRTVKAVRSDNCCFFAAEEVLEILDKYKAESRDNV